MPHILIIDDNESLREATSLILRSEGHTVDAADGGKAGLALYMARGHDLVITDILMPDMDGLELIDHLRKATPRPRVIAMSGGRTFSMPVHLPAAKNLGVERILAKPIRSEVLVRTVADVLAQAPSATLRQAEPDED